MSTPQNAQAPQPLPGTQQSGNEFQGITQSLGNYNLYDPNTASNLSYGIVNNPYQGGYQGAAGTAGNLATGGGLNMFQAGSGLYGLGNQLGANVFANQPGGQPALYHYLQNQNTQQSNVENAMAGVATTPYGAGVTDYSNMRFNLDWQNFLQQQQLAAAGGAQNAFQGAAGLQQQAPVEYLYGGGLPYGTANTIGQTGLGALGGLQQYGQGAAQIPYMQSQAFGNYATGAQNANTQAANLGWQESIAPWSAIGNIAGMGLGGLAYGYGRGL